jgi:hypothetical protein
MESQQCNTCYETKPLDEFHANRNNKNGRQVKCKFCVANNRKQTHRYCRKCKDLKEVCEYNGSSKTCKICSPEKPVKTRKSYYPLSREEFYEREMSSVYGIAEWV